MKKTFVALIKLARCNEYDYSIIITTLFGVATAQGMFSGRLLGILLANALAICFAYMVNDIEDAAEDTLSTQNCLRNPISAGLILPKTARLAALIVGLTATGLYALMGMWPFVFGASCLVLGFLYSHKVIRLKAFPLINSISRGLLLAGLPFLASYFSFSDGLNRIWYWPFIWLFTLSILFERRGSRSRGDGAQITQLQHMAEQFGERCANLMITVLIIVSTATGIVSVFMVNLMPSWVIITVLVLLAIIIGPPYFKSRYDETNLSMQSLLIHAIDRAFAVGLLAQFFLPWLDKVIN